MKTEKKKAEATQMDTEFTGPFPRYSGAITSIIEGSPEDMNEMPASLNEENSYAISPTNEQTSHSIPDGATKLRDELENS